MCPGKDLGNSWLGDTKMSSKLTLCAAAYGLAEATELCWTKGARLGGSLSRFDHEMSGQYKPFMAKMKHPRAVMTTSDRCSHCVSVLPRFGEPGAPEPN
jgi:hypothetical protein